MTIIHINIAKKKVERSVIEAGAEMINVALSTIKIQTINDLTDIKNRTHIH
jgi:hypothetical protein